jgi:hypothetical protein
MGKVLKFPIERTFTCMLPDEWADPHNPTQYELAQTMRTLHEMKRDVEAEYKKTSAAALTVQINKINSCIQLMYSYYRSD